MENEDVYGSLRDRLNDLTERLEKVEERLDKLEGSASLISRRKRRSRIEKGTGSEGEDSISHNYLKKTIDEAKRRYEREHRI